MALCHTQWLTIWATHHVTFTSEPRLRAHYRCAEHYNEQLGGAL